MLYLYAFVRSLSALPEALGLEGAPPELVQAGSLDAVVSRHDRLEPEIAADALVAHARVVDALIEATEDVAPVRFGSVFSDEACLQTEAAANQAGLEDVLRRVRGRVEFGLHIVRTPREREEQPTADGRNRLLGRLAELRTADDAARLDEPLVRLAVDTRRRLLRTPRLLLSAAYLVERTRIAEFAECSRAIAAGRPPGLEVLATGPWPPYSFAELEDGLRAA